ncbi:MAG: nucleotidyltransferase domain-containing protein [Devosia sp.]
MPPMNFHGLMEGVDLPANLTDQINVLLEKKRLTKEMGVMPRIEGLERFALSEFSLAKDAAESTPKEAGRFDDAANALFRAIIKMPLRPNS